MPHFKCAPCRTRLDSGEVPADLADAFCPDCGAVLEPVGELAEVVGFRSITSLNHAAEDDKPAQLPWSETLGNLDARRAIHGDERVDADRWGDDGGSFAAEAISLPRPETSR